MTKEDALLIKEWRKTATWRSVATKAAQEWPDRDIIAGHQMEGADLCDRAAKVLGEKPNSPDWN